MTNATAGQRSYGSPRVFKDLREQGQTCGENRVARLMREVGIKAIRSYKRRYRRYCKLPQPLGSGLCL